MECRRRTASLHVGGRDHFQWDECLRQCRTRKRETLVDVRKLIIQPLKVFDNFAINAVAARHRLPVIDDAAQSFGASYKGRRSGVLAEITCTSFFPSKPLGCYGDGGACFTDDDELAIRIRQIRVHGQDRRYHHPIIGVNGRLDTLQAAILLAKLEVFDEEVAARQRVASRYASALSAVVRPPELLPGNTSVYAQYTIEVDDRDRFVAALKKEGIPTAVHYPIPLNLQPAFASLGRGPGSFPHAEHAAGRVVSLPMHPVSPPRAIRTGSAKSFARRSHRCAAFRPSRRYGMRVPGPEARARLSDRDGSIPRSRAGRRCAEAARGLRGERTARI